MVWPKVFILSSAYFILTKLNLFDIFYKDVNYTEKMFYQQEVSFSMLRVEFNDSCQNRKDLFRSNI